MSKLKCIQAKARELARSGKFYGWPPLEFELRFEDGFSEARECLHRPATRDELDPVCQEARKPHLLHQHPANEAAYVRVPTRASILFIGIAFSKRRGQP